MFNSLTKQPFCHVYVAKFINGVTVEKTSSPARDVEIQSVSNPSLKLEKYEVWRLLEYALLNSLGVNANSLNFYKDEGGKWQTNGVYFSLSHSHGALSVAVSNSPVGVDIQLVKTPRQNAVERVLTSSEKEAVSVLSGDEKTLKLLSLWSQKESVFKRGGFRFVTDVETVNEKVDVKVISLEGNNYVLATASELISNIKYFINVNYLN